MSLPPLDIVLNVARDAADNPLCVRPGSAAVLEKPAAWPSGVTVDARLFIQSGTAPLEPEAASLVLQARVSPGDPVLDELVVSVVSFTAATRLGRPCYTLSLGLNAPQLLSKIDTETIDLICALRIGNEWMATWVQPIRRATITEETPTVLPFVPPYPNTPTDGTLLAGELVEGVVVWVKKTYAQVWTKIVTAVTAAQMRTDLSVESTTELNARDTANRARANHTGTQSADTLTDGTTNKAFLATERTKLAGIEAGATANSSDATLLARANHTGTQLASTISNFAATVLATTLTGLSLATGTAITSADSILVAAGKLQAQITALLGRTISGGGLVTGGGNLSADRTLTVTAATSAEAITGTETGKAMTPAADKAALDARFASWVRDTGWIYSDGATSGRGQIQIPGARGNLAGAALAEWCGWVTVPTALTATDVSVFAMQANTSSLNQADSLVCDFFGGLDYLSIAQLGTGSFSNCRRFDHPTFRSVYSGKKIWLEVRFTQGTTAPVVLVDGVDISAAFTASTSGTPPDWLAASANFTAHITGFLYPVGEAPLGCWLNAHLTQAESDDWRTKGKIPVWVAAGGSMVNQQSNGSFETYTGTQDDGTSDTFTNWAAITTDGVVESIAAGRTGSAVKLTRSAVTGANNHRLYTDPLFVRAGKFTASVWTKGDGTNSLRVEAFLAGYGEVVASTSTGLTGSGSWQQFTITFEVPLYGQLYFTLSTPQVNGAVIMVDDFSLISHGALSLPSVQPIPVLDDVTGIGGNPARLVGMIAITDKTDWRISANTATNGNEQLLGGAVLDPSRDVIEFMEQTPLADSTTTIGSSSGGSQYKASGIIYVAIQPVTLATREVTSNSVWVGSNTSATIRTTITGHRAY